MLSLSLSPPSPHTGGPTTHTTLALFLSCAFCDLFLYWCSCRCSRVRIVGDTKLFHWSLAAVTSLSITPIVKTWALPLSLTWNLSKSIYSLEMWNTLKTHLSNAETIRFKATVLTITYGTVHATTTQTNDPSKKTSAFLIAFKTLTRSLLQAVRHLYRVLVWRSNSTRLLNSGKFSQAHFKSLPISQPNARPDVRYEMACHSQDSPYCFTTSCSSNAATPATAAALVLDPSPKEWKRGFKR